MVKPALKSGLMAEAEVELMGWPLQLRQGLRRAHPGTLRMRRGAMQLQSSRASVTLRSAGIESACSTTRAAQWVCCLLCECSLCSGANTPMGQRAPKVPTPL